MRYIIYTLFLIASTDVVGQQADLKETKAEKGKRMEWWRDATFGMFIHWGLYSVPGGIYNGKEVDGIGEWIMHNANIPISEYEQYAAQFNPTYFNAREWVQIAKEGGAKYIVITTKHHDGFCLWDSKVTEYDIMDATPFKRDILEELSVACKEVGMRLCFYYSIMDWHQPDAQAKNYEHQKSANPDWSRYRDQYMKPQLSELIKNYDPGMLWFDGEWIDEWTEEQGKDLYGFLRNLKPTLIINNRVGKGRKGMNGMNAYKDAAGDFGTPEQEILEGTSGFDWEACMTMNDTWGFKKNDHNWKSPEVLIHNLIDIAAKGGNYLLNVGPSPEGDIPDVTKENLKQMGEWLKVNGEAIYNTTNLKKYKEGDYIRFTKSKGGRYSYAILLKVPLDRMVILRDVKLSARSKIKLLGMDQNIQWRRNKEGGVTVTLPEAIPGKFAWVLRY